MVFFNYGLAEIPDDQTIDCMAIPRWVARELFEERARAEGLEVAEGEMSVGPYEAQRGVPAWLLKAPKDQPRTFTLDDAARLTGAPVAWLKKMSAMANLIVVPLFVPAVPPLHVLYSGLKEKEQNQRATYDEALGVYGRILEQLHALYGHRFHFHLKYDGDVVPFLPLPSPLGDIDLFINMRPPGEAEKTDRYDIFGLSIGLNGKMQKCEGPASGVGTVLKDQNDIPVVQVVGRSVFLLTPVCSVYNQYTSEIIFWKLMALALKGLKAEAERVWEQKKAEDLADEVAPWMRYWDKDLQEDIKNRQEKIQSFLQALAMEQRAVRELTNVLKVVEASDLVQKAQQRMPDDFKRMLANDQVARVWIAENGIHVATKDLIVLHKDRRFLIGALTIRMTRKGGVHVWSEDPKGPGWAPHPHVDRYEDPCFGNAGVKIAKLLSEQRYADALETILASLTRGYSPELTLRPIEAWPEIDADGKVIEGTERGSIKGILDWLAADETLAPLQPLFEQAAQIIELGPEVREPSGDDEAVVQEDQA